jgi:hypothetical protein
MAGDKITAEEFAAWPLASQALKQVQAVQGNRAPSAILQRLSDGLIRAYAAEAIVNAMPVQTLYPISIRIWRAVNEWGSHWNLAFWDTNDTEVELYGTGTDPDIEVRLYGIRFDPVGIEKMLPAEAKPSPAPVPARATPIPAPPEPVAQIISSSRAGRPRKDFWDDLIIATMKAIWDGDLQPKTYADVERWMLTWASDHDHKLSDTTVKGPAKKVFAAHQG